MKKTLACIMLCVMLLVSNIASLAVSAEGLYSEEFIYLDVGTTTLTLDTTYPYALMVVAPSETGQYTVACDDHLIGIVSYTDMWVQNEPSESNVNANEAEWKCTSVGQGIIVAIETTGGEATVTLSTGEMEEKEEVQWVIYENQATVEAFTFTGDAASLLRVDTYDNVVDEAVLGADGYYHLNSAKGPILYANVKDSAMSLAAMITYGQVKEVVQDSDYTILSKTDFNTAAQEYVDCCDSKTNLYPLTVDLIEMFKRVGAYQGWYGTGGYLGGNLDDAWMFACYYNELPEATQNGDVNGDGAVNLDDATAMFYYVNGLASFDEETMAVADVNGDGGVNLNDATALFYLVNGLTAE